MDRIEERYERQVRFGALGQTGQQRLAAARVLIVGLGALGSVISELLARAGVGYLRLVDRDTVEWSNLQRQSLYTESDAEAGLAKADAAAQRLRAINSQIELDPRVVDLGSNNALELAQDVDVIVDGTDNFSARFLINDVSLELRRPWVHGGCVGAAGQVFLFWPGETICFRCLLVDPPPAGSTATCDTAGVIGPASHLVASLQATEAMRAIVMGTTAVRSQVLNVDVWGGRWRPIETTTLRGATCVACDGGQRDFLKGGNPEVEPVVLCGRGAVQIPAPARQAPLDLARIKQRWKGLGRVNDNSFLIRLTFADGRIITLFRDGRAVIGGTEDIAIARSLYARYVGI